MIIFLNGASSSGKTALARSMQVVAADKNFLVAGVDTFINMMPNSMIGFDQQARQGFLFEKLHDKVPRVKISTGPFAEKLVASGAKVMELLVNQGFNLIVDEVLLTKTSLRQYVEALQHHKVYFVKVFCELKILQEREIMRGNRTEGLARDHFDIIEQPFFNYDLTVDNSRASLFELAEQVFDFIAKNSNPEGFKKMLTTL